MPDAIQLSLFSDAQTDTTEESQIVWSYSRRQTLEQCARRYYHDCPTELVQPTCGTTAASSYTPH